MNLVLPIFWIIIIYVFVNRITLVKFERTMRKCLSFKNILDFFFKIDLEGNCYDY